MKPLNPSLRAGKSFTGKRTFLAQNGLHSTIFDYVIKHPGKPLKSDLWTKMFKMPPFDLQKNCGGNRTTLEKIWHGHP